MSSLRIRFSEHALLKFQVLREHGFDLSQEVVEEIVRAPSRVSSGYHGRSVAQSPLYEKRLLRVVYEEKAGEIIIITFYPARRARYEKDTV